MRSNNWCCGRSGVGRSTSASGVTRSCVAAHVTAAALLATEVTEEFLQQAAFADAAATAVTSAVAAGRFAGSDFATASWFASRSTATVSNFATTSWFASDFTWSFAAAVAAFGTEQLAEQAALADAASAVAARRFARSDFAATSWFASGFACRCTATISDFATASWFCTAVASAEQVALQQATTGVATATRSFATAIGFASRSTSAVAVATAARCFQTTSRFTNRSFAASCRASAAFHAEHAIKQVKAKALSTDRTRHDHRQC